MQKKQEEPGTKQDGAGDDTQDPPDFSSRATFLRAQLESLLLSLPIPGRPHGKPGGLRRRLRGGSAAAAPPSAPAPRPPNPKGCFLLLPGQRELWAPPGASPAVTLCPCLRTHRHRLHGNEQNAVPEKKTQRAHSYGDLVRVLLLRIQETQCLTKAGSSLSFPHHTYTRVCKDPL